MSELPKYAINVLGVQVHAGKEPSHFLNGKLYFEDQTFCVPETRNNRGGADVVFVDFASEAFLTPQTAPSVTFVTYDSRGSMSVVSGGGKSNAKMGDPQGNRCITIGDNTVQQNTFD